MQTQAADIAYFKLKEARSYRFRNLPTVRMLDVQAGQVLKVTDARDIEYFRCRGDVMVECDPSGHGVNEPVAGTITAPNALSKRQWRSPNAPPVSSVAQQQLPGTMLVNGRMPPAQNPTGQSQHSIYNQHPPGLVHKGDQPQAMAPQAARPTVTMGSLGLQSRVTTQPMSQPSAPGDLVEVRLGQVTRGNRPVAGSTPLIAPVASQSDGDVVDPPVVRAALSMHPGAQEPAAKEAPSTENEDAVQLAVGQLPDGSIDPAYLAQPITPGGVVQRPIAMRQGNAPQVVGGKPNPVPGTGSGVTASGALQAMARGHSVPSGAAAEHILAEMGSLAETPESGIERIGSDGRPSGSY